MLHHIGNTNNNLPVTVDLIRSRAAHTLSRSPRLLAYIKEALENLAPKADTESLEHDFGRPIGYSDIVTTEDDTAAFYAKRTGDKIFTRFIKGGKPASTSKLSLILTKNIEGNYELADVWVGGIMPAQPGDANESTESIPFWQAHAYLCNDQPLQASTITKASPY